MAYIAGVVFFLMGAVFAWVGFNHKRKSMREEARIRAENPDARPTEMHPSLSILVDFAPSLTIFSLGLLVLTVTVAFFAVNALQWFSLFDLAGMYAMVAGYSYWMYMKTRHRSVETLRALAAKSTQT